jgi:hypothetical protein
VHLREILSGYFLFSRFDWSVFVTQLVAKHMEEIINENFSVDKYFIKIIFDLLKVFLKRELMCDSIVNYMSKRKFSEEFL